MEQFSLEKWLQNKSRKVVTRDGRPVRIVCWDKLGHYPIIGCIKDLYNDEYVETYTIDGVCSLNYNDKNDLFFADEKEELTEFEKAIYQYICTIVTACDGNVFGNKELKPIAKETAKDLLDLARKEIETENSEFKPKFTYNEKDYSELANKLIEFRNNTPLCSVSYRNGEGRKIIIHYEKEILDLVRKELEANYYTKVLDDRMVFKSELHATDLQTAYDMGKQDALKDLPKWKKATEYKEFEINEVCILGDDIYPIIATDVNIGEYYIELDELKNLPIEE